MLLLVLTITVACAMAQRPMYAGSGPIGRPELANRFRDPAAETSTTATGLSNRLGEDSTPPPNLPVDALGDEELVNRLNQWPREHRPFWLLNSAAIEEQRNQNVNRLVQQAQAQQNQQNQQAQGQQPLESRRSFNNFDQQSTDDQVASLPIRPTGQRPTFWSRGN